MPSTHTSTRPVWLPEPPTSRTLPGVHATHSTRVNTDFSNIRVIEKSHYRLWTEVTVCLCVQRKFMNFSEITLEILCIHFNLAAIQYSNDDAIALPLHKMSCYNSCLVSWTTNCMHCIKRLSFQPAIYYLSFRWVNTSHASTVNSVNKLVKNPKNIPSN